eukprot:Sspe_Gene.50610::Locus_28159_Transcript_1_1_Confidence_1.000_Length_825::g.50610::m.50610
MDGTEASAVSLGPQTGRGLFSFIAQVKVDPASGTWSRLIDCGKTVNGLGRDYVYVALNPEGKLALGTYDGGEMRIVAPTPFPRGQWVWVEAHVQANGKVDARGRKLATATLSVGGSVVAEGTIFMSDFYRPQCYLGKSAFSHDPILKGAMQFVKVTATH